MRSLFNPFAHTPLQPHTHTHTHTRVSVLTLFLIVLSEEEVVGRLIALSVPVLHELREVSEARGIPAEPVPPITVTGAPQGLYHGPGTGEKGEREEGGGEGGVGRGKKGHAVERKSVCRLLVDECEKNGRRVMSIVTIKRSVHIHRS